MIRPMQSTDLPDLLALLHWMDDAPEREVFAPAARDVSELPLECEDHHLCLVDADEEGVRAYCALAPFRDGLVLEGPLSEQGDSGASPATLAKLVGRAVQEAEGLPVYAFCARHNQPVRDALEAAGFSPMHSTAFYQAPLGQLTPLARVPDGDELVAELPIQEYRALYKAAEDAWADRLNWTPEQYAAHFARDDVALVALMRAGHALGFAELEYHPEEARADVTYLAVHPAERAGGYGRTLLALAAAQAATRPELRTLRVRAHDHMTAARTLYARSGFTHCRSVVTYLKEGDDGEV